MSSRLFDLLAVHAGPERRVDGGAQLFARGDPVEALYLVCEGEVQLCRIGEDGARVILQRAGPGDILAEASALSERYHCAGVAAVETRVRAVPVARLRARTAQEPELAVEMLRHMGRELRQARMRAEILALKTVRARLAAWREWQAGALPARGNWRHLAEELGVSAEALYREIARLKSEGNWP